MNDSNKMPLLLAAGAIGGAVGYLFFTESGKRTIDSIARFRIEKTALIPEKIEAARQFIEDRGKNVTGRVSDVVDRLKGSVDAGRRAYDEAGQVYHQQIDKLHVSNDEVILNLHRAVDTLGKLFRTSQETLLDPFFEIGAIARGVERGVRQLGNGNAERQRPTSFSAHRRVMG